jgi:Rieske Fe-S protein
MASVSDTHTLVSRRQFCAGACQAASCAALASLAAACSGGSPSAPEVPVSTLPVLQGQLAGSTVRVTAGSALANVGGAALVESTAGLFLMARTSATTFSTVEAVCTHEGCTINGAAGDVYVCPCHGSRYNRSGQVLQGPARAALRQYATTVNNDVVTIAL